MLPLSFKYKKCKEHFMKRGLPWKQNQQTVSWVQKSKSEEHVTAYFGHI